MRDPLAVHPIFALVEPAVRQALLAVSTVRELGARRRVLSEGERAQSIFALIEGAVRVSLQSQNGDEVAVKLFRAPALFGEAEAIHGVAYQENVDTVERSRLVEMPADAVRRCLETSSAAAMAFAEDLARRLAIAAYHQRSLAFHPVTVRLANYLLDYAEWTGTLEDGEWQIALSQDEMAAAIGATRRSIGKDVTLWQEEGILERCGRAYRVCDPVALARYSDPERLRLAYRIAGRP